MQRAAALVTVLLAALTLVAAVAVRKRHADRAAPHRDHRPEGRHAAADDRDAARRRGPDLVV